jgi:spore germination cell wall hydrolase CwlJ-like protein
LVQQNALKAADLKLKQASLMQKAAAGDQQARLQLAELWAKNQSAAADRASRERIAAIRMAGKNASGFEQGGAVGDGAGNDWLATAVPGVDLAPTAWDDAASEGESQPSAQTFDGTPWTDPFADGALSSGLIIPLTDLDSASQAPPAEPVPQAAAGIGSPAPEADVVASGLGQDASDAGSGDSQSPAQAPVAAENSRDPESPGPIEQAAAPLGDCANGDPALLARLIYAEASDHFDVDGAMEAVGWTVRNRLAAPGFPKSLQSVIFQPNAFAAIGQPRWQEASDPAALTGRAAASYRRACSVAKGILDGSIPDPRPGSTFFHSREPRKGDFFYSRLRSGRLVQNGDRIGKLTFFKEVRPTQPGVR